MIKMMYTGIMTRKKNWLHSVYLDVIIKRTLKQYNLLGTTDNRDYV